MKLKLIAAAAFAVCGSSAFAGATYCSSNAGTSSVTLVTLCAPEVTVYMAGASAQQPAVKTLLTTTSTIFDTSKVIAIVSPSTGAIVSGTKADGTSGTTTVATESGTGAKKTTIYLGIGATGTTNAGKRIAVVYNTANGSFAGVKQMLEKKGTADPLSSTGGTNGEENSQRVVTATMQQAGTALNCVRTSTSDWSATGGTSGAPYIPTYACAGNSHNYLTTAPSGGVTGVQLALADVAPKQAVLGVLQTSGSTAWSATKYPLTITGMQGFGIMVNDKALQALISREVTAGRLPSTCVAANIYGSAEAVSVAGGSATLITAACQPSIRSSDMTALITGKAKASLISGNSADDGVKTIAYYRRVPFSGTQAASNIMFAGQAATEGFSAPAVVAGTMTVSGYTEPILGTTTTALKGDYSYTSSSGKYLNVAKLSGSDVISAVSGSSNASNYAFGIASLENVWTSSSASSALKGATWVKLDGISPNYDMSTGNHDTKQRVGMLAGYPFQFEMVAIKNPLNQTGPKAVVDAIVTALATPSYNLAGIAYIGGSSNAATFYRGGLGNNYAPLTSYATTAY